MLDFKVGEGRLAARAPVYEVFPAIDESLLIEFHKYFADGAREPLVHREALAVPVAGGAELFELVYDRAAVLLFPLPDLFDELFASKVVT